MYQSTLTHLGRGAIVLAILAALAACGKKSDLSTTDTSSGAIAPASGAVRVADVTLGHGVSGDEHVLNQADSFASRDSIFLSIHTTGSAPNANLGVRWMYEDGQVVDQRTQTISPNGDAHTEFHIAKPSGWPPGKYTAHVSLNGQEVQTKEFTVTK